LLSLVDNGEIESPAFDSRERESKQKDFRFPVSFVSETDPGSVLANDVVTEHFADTSYNSVRNCRKQRRPSAPCRVRNLVREVPMLSQRPYCDPENAPEMNRASISTKNPLKFRAPISAREA
jgi:hypothetical protein